MPEWSSGFLYFLQFQSEFGNEFMIWATVSSPSCFCWLYRASPSLDQSWRIVFLHYIHLFSIYFPIIKKTSQIPKLLVDIFKVISPPLLIVSWADFWLNSLPPSLGLETLPLSTLSPLSPHKSHKHVAFFSIVNKHIFRMVVDFQQTWV